MGMELKMATKKKGKEDERTLAGNLTILNVLYKNKRKKKHQQPTEANIRQQMRMKIK